MSPTTEEGFSEPDTPNSFLANVVSEATKTATIARLEAEKAHLRQALWGILLATGYDPDGDHRVPPPGACTPDVPELAAQAVKELRADLDQACGLVPDPGEIVVRLDDLVAVLREAEGFIGSKDNEPFSRLAAAAGVE